MIGGGNLAFTILGIYIDEDIPKNAQFLIMDPHYKGPDNIDMVLGKKSKAIYWTNINHFSNKGFYNLCLPLGQ